MDKLTKNMFCHSEPFAAEGEEGRKNLIQRRIGSLSSRHYVPQDRLTLRSLRMTIIVLLLLHIPAYAFEAANPYWFAIKPKLEKYLATAIDTKLYQYEIVGPAGEMKNFLGNHPDAEIKFEKLNLKNPGEKKTLVAVAYNPDGSRADSIIINLNVKRYQEVMVLKKAIKQGDAINLEDTYKEKILAEALDEQLYYNGDLTQKFASSNLNAGTRLKINMLRHEKLIKTGEYVKVTSGSKFVQLEFSCRAASSGDIGDTISLLCPDIERKNLKAIITANGVARLN